MTWHFGDLHWRLNSVPVTCLNLGSSRTTAEKLRDIMSEILQTSKIRGSDDNTVFSATTDSEAESA